MIGFFDTYRQLYPVTCHLLRWMADHFQEWLKGWAEWANVPVFDAPAERRGEFVDPLA